MSVYRKILVALDNGEADKNLLAHIAKLAKFHDAELLLVHVADGWVARNYDKLQLAESDEMKEDRAYLDQCATSLREQGLKVSVHLALGEPSKEILKLTDAEQCDLIAMGGHGHRLLSDIVLGSAINEVRHHAKVPVLLVRAGT
jgi:nucleotide-binding universal stress UspA family protein